MLLGLLGSLTLVHSMGSSGQFGSHVFIELVEACQTECMSGWDKLLVGTILVTCTLFGVPANVLALKYFWSKRSKQLPDLLYQAICSIDIYTCVAHIPVALALLNDRYPILFNNLNVCASWDALFTFLKLVSMFLVMLLSVSKCIAIIFPFQEVHKNRYLFAFYIYCIILITQIGFLVPLVHGLTINYGADAAFCYAWYEDTVNPGHTTGNSTDATGAYTIHSPIYTASTASSSKIWYTIIQVDLN